MVHGLDDLQIILAVSVLASKWILSVPFAFEGSLLDICVVSKPTRCVECFVYLKNGRSNSVVLSFEFSTSYWLSPQIFSDPGPPKYSTLGRHRGISR